jgi:hypothetical protein
MAQSELGRQELNTMFPELSEAQLYNFFLWFRPEMRNSCVRYAEDSRFMDMLAQVKMPEGADMLRAIAAGKNQNPN